MPLSISRAYRFISKYNFYLVKLGKRFTTGQCNTWLYFSSKRPFFNKQGPIFPPFLPKQILVSNLTSETWFKGRKLILIFAEQKIKLEITIKTKKKNRIETRPAISDNLKYEGPCPKISTNIDCMAVERGMRKLF